MRADKQKLEGELSRIVESLKQLGAQRIILFGSLARGRIRVSTDIDLIAVFDDQMTFKERMKHVYSHLDAREAVDILAYNEDESEQIRNKPSFRHVLRNARALYG